MNYVMLFCTPVYFVLLGMASGSLKITIGLVVLLALVVIYLVLLKVFHVWNKPTYSFRKSDD